MKYFITNLTCYRKIHYIESIFFFCYFFHYIHLNEISLPLHSLTDVLLVLVCKYPYLICFYRPCTYRTCTVKNMYFSRNFFSKQQKQTNKTKQYAKNKLSEQYYEQYRAKLFFTMNF